jgi:hypothetical protein
LQPDKAAADSAAWNGARIRESAGLGMSGFMTCAIASPVWELRPGSACQSSEPSSVIGGPWRGGRDASLSPAIFRSQEPTPGRSGKTPAHRLPRAAKARTKAAGRGTTESGLFDLPLPAALGGLEPSDQEFRKQAQPCQSMTACDSQHAAGQGLSSILGCHPVPPATAGFHLAVLTGVWLG